MCRQKTFLKMVEIYAPFSCVKKCRTLRTACGERRRGLADNSCCAMPELCWSGSLPPFALRLLMIIWRNWNLSRLSAAGADAASMGQRRAHFTASFCCVANYADWTARLRAFAAVEEAGLCGEVARWRGFHSLCQTPVKIEWCGLSAGMWQLGGS